MLNIVLLNRITRCETSNSKRKYVSKNVFRGTFKFDNFYFNYHIEANQVNFSLFSRFELRALSVHRSVPSNVHLGTVYIELKIKVKISGYGKWNIDEFWTFPSYRDIQVYMMKKLLVWGLLKKATKCVIYHRLICPTPLNKLTLYN